MIKEKSINVVDSVIKVKDLKTAFDSKYYDLKSDNKVAVIHGIAPELRDKIAKENIDKNIYFVFGKVGKDRIVNSINGINKKFVFYSDDSLISKVVSKHRDCEKACSLKDIFNGKLSFIRVKMLDKLFSDAKMNILSKKLAGESLIVKASFGTKNGNKLNVPLAVLDAMHRNSLGDDSFYESLENNPWCITHEDVNQTPEKKFMLQRVNLTIWKYFSFTHAGVEAFRELNLDHSDDPAKAYAERAQYAVFSGVKDQTLKKDFQQAINYNEPSSTASIFPYFRHVWYVDGTSFEARELIQTLTKMKNVSSARLMTAASFFCDAGDHEVAIRLAYQAKKKENTAWEKNRFLGLTELLVSEGRLNTQWSINDSEIYKHIRKNEGRFEELIRNNAGSFAVIGNSPVQIGQGKGNEIDRKNIVARFNTAPVSKQYCEDYGEKHDIWFVSPKHYQVRRQPARSNVKLVVFSGSCPLYYMSNSFSALRDYVEKYEVQMLPDIHRRQVIEEIKGNPSTGLVALSWINSLVGNLEDQKNVFGFSLSDQLHKTTAHYYEKGLVKSKNSHEWGAERSLFDKLVSSSKVM